MHPRLRIFLTVGALAIAACAATAIAAPLSTPALSVLGASRTSITAVITAGEMGAPAGFTLEWMPASEFDAIGAWPAAGDARVRSGVFDGVPTLNT